MAAINWIALLWQPATFVVVVAILLTYLIAVKKIQVGTGTRYVLYLLAVVLVIGGLGYGGWFSKEKGLGQFLAAAPTPVTPVTPVVTTVTGEVCFIEDTTITLDDQNIFSLGTAVTGGGWHRVFVDGYDKGYINDGASFTASPGDTVRVVFAENSTGDSTGAYSREVIITVPCKGTFDLKGEVCQFDTSPTVTFWTENEQVIQSGTNQTMGADTQYTLPYKVKASNDLCVGNINHVGSGNVLCYEYNKTAFDKIEVIDSRKAPTPEAQTVATGNTTDCWYVSTVSDNGEIRGSVLFDTHATNNPRVDLDEPGWYLYDVDIDLDADYLTTVNDVEDEDGNNIGYTTTAYVASGTILID